jgi:hypothetical protein
MLQIPWGRWGGGALVVELDDVTLEVTSRNDSDWEEGPALFRAQAAKQAQLAAAELAKLGSRVAAEGHKQQEKASSSSSSKGSTRWSIVDYITSYLLNRLQLTVTNVHLCFKVSPSIKYSRRQHMYPFQSTSGPALRTAFNDLVKRNNSCSFCKSDIVKLLSCHGIVAFW